MAKRETSNYRPETADREGQKAWSEIFDALGVTTPQERRVIKRRIRKELNFYHNMQSSFYGRPVTEQKNGFAV